MKRILGLIVLIFITGTSLGIMITSPGHSIEFSNAGEVFGLCVLVWVAVLVVWLVSKLNRKC